MKQLDNAVLDAISGGRAHPAVPGAQLPDDSHTALTVVRLPLRPGKVVERPGGRISAAPQPVFDPLNTLA